MNEGVPYDIQLLVYFQVSGAEWLCKGEKIEGLDVCDKVEFWRLGMILYFFSIFEDPHLIVPQIFHL